MSDTQSGSKFRNEIPAAYPQSCDLPSCPRCGGKVEIYRCFDEADLLRWCYTYALPRKDETCNFCHEGIFPHLFTSPDDAAAAWQAKVDGFKSKIGPLANFLIGVLVFMGLVFSASVFIQSLNCGCFEWFKK